MHRPIANSRQKCSMHARVALLRCRFLLVFLGFALEEEKVCVCPRRLSEAYRAEAHRQLPNRHPRKNDTLICCNQENPEDVKSQRGLRAQRGRSAKRAVALWDTPHKLI